MLALLVSAETNLEFSSQTAFEQYYCLAQREKPSSTIAGVLAQLLSGCIGQIVLRHGQMGRIGILST